MPDDTPLPLGPYLTGRVEHAGGVATVMLAGEFDMAAVAPVRELLVGLEATGPRAIVLDLTELGFLDSSGVRVLIDAHERSRGERAFALLRGSGPAHRALTMMGIDQLLTVISSVDELGGAPSAAEGVEAAG